MGRIEWTPDLKVGVEKVDEQHKKLFQLIDDFYANIQSKSPMERMEGLISAMKEYSVFHFSEEEALMLKAGYADYAVHKRQHDAFIAKVDDYTNRLKSGKLILSVEITNFIKEWLVKHISVMDKAYVPTFAEKGMI
jgi:hemerythrin